MLRNCITCKPFVGSPWFRVSKVSKEDYKDMLERREQRELPDGKKSVKERIDDAW